MQFRVVFVLIVVFMDTTFIKICGMPHLACMNEETVMTCLQWQYKATEILLYVHVSRHILCICALIV